MANKKQPKPLVAPFDELNTKLWWEYRQVTQEDLNTINTFLQTNLKDLQLGTDLYENMKFLTKTLGLYHHPFVNYPVKKTIKPGNENLNLSSANPVSNEHPPATKPGQQNTLAAQQQQQQQQQLQAMSHSAIDQSPESNLVLINHLKVDAITIRLLAFCWSYSKLECLKLSNNSLDATGEKLLLDFVTTPGVKLSKLFYDWNPPKEQDFFTRLSSSPCIEFLSLRCNGMTNKQVRLLCDGLKNNNILKFLDLYNNEISQEGVEALAELLNQSGSLEYLGLAKNELSQADDVASLFKVIGRFPITQEEAEEQQRKEKEKEATILKNQKMKNKKGYVEEPVPILDPIQQLDDGSWILLKNNKISLINLSLNGFDDSSVQAFAKFLTNTGDHFSLVLAENKFQETTKTDLKSKFQNRVLI